MKKIVFPLVVLALVLGLSLSLAGQVGAQFHGATIQKIVLGPGGAGNASVGDTVNASIRVTNTDDFDHALNITSISDVVHHASGDVATGNLLPAPGWVELAPMGDPGDSVVVWHTYVVEVGDGPELADTASCLGIDPTVGGFSLTFPGLIPIISADNPEIDIEKTVDFNGDGVYTDSEINSAGETASWRIVVCNTGDTTVYNIVVTDTNGHNFGDPFDLNPGNCTTFTYDMAMYANTVNTACAEGMDEADAPVGPVCDPAQVSILSHHVPTLSQWGMIGMAILFAALLIWSIRRRWLVSASRR